MDKYVLVIITIVLASAVHNAAAATSNLLVNPGFETGNFSGWMVGGNSVQTGVAVDGTPIPNVDPEFIPAFQNVRSGTFAANALVKDVHDPAEFITLTQVITVNPNQDIDVGFWLGNDSQHAFGISVDNNHTEIFVDDIGVLPSGSHNVSPGRGPGNFLELHRTFNTGTRTSITVSFEINGSGTAPAGASFDDFFFTPIPESGTLVILGVGFTAAGLAWRRGNTRISSKR